MRAGQLRERITIQQPGETQDEAGQPIEGWTDVCTVRAAKRDLNGREFIAAQGVQNAVAAKFEIRYRADVLANMRVVHGSDIYNILAPLDPAGRRQQLFLMCEQVAG